MNGTVRHYTGTDYERAFRESPLWEGIPANLATAVERVEAHLAHQRTSVTEVWWIASPGSTPQFVIHFTDGTGMWGQYGFVNHGRTQVAGSKPMDDGTWYYELPENRLRDVSGTSDPVASQPLHCGVRQPAGSACFVCGEQVG